MMETGEAYGRAAHGSDVDAMHGYRTWALATAPRHVGGEGRCRQHSSSGGVIITLTAPSALEKWRARRALLTSEGFVMFQKYMDW